MSHWTADDIPDQSGKTVLITGANTGLGFETAKVLAHKGAHVIMACRSEDKGQAAKAEIEDTHPSGSLELRLVDLADLESVKSLGATLREELEKIDTVVLNAGVMVPPMSRTQQGYELQFGVNHLGHFALCGLLLPLIPGEEGRIVVISSMAARNGRIDFDDLNWEDKRYDAWRAYGQSKLANQLFARELQRRLEAASSPVKVVLAHPGWTATDLQRSSGMARILNPLLAMKVEQGTLPQLRAATDPAVGPADYFGPGGFFQMRGYPERVDFVKAAWRDEDARKLWEVSEELTGVAYEL